MATQVVGTQARRPYRSVYGYAGDRYMEKAQEAADPIIRKAMERMVDAAREAFSAKSQLTYALDELERHPDYTKTERARKAKGSVVSALTLAWWVHNCAHAALHDAELAEVGDWLLVDADPRRSEANLRQFAQEEKRDKALFARRRKRQEARRRKRAERRRAA